MKNLGNYGVQELSTKEIKDIDGGTGILEFIVGAIVGGLLYDGVKEIAQNGSFGITDSGYAGSKF